jgi:hypothetical protein
VREVDRSSSKLVDAVLSRVNEDDHGDR